MTVVQSRPTSPARRVGSASMCLVFAVVLLALTGCSGTAVSESVVKKGVFEAGVDIRPGVYATSSGGDTCTAFVSRTADYDLMDDNGDPDGFLRGATVANDGQRIEVKRGEFLQILGCTWQREKATGPRSDDPATMAGGCAILTGKSGAVAQAMRFYPVPDKSAADERRRAETQDRLFALVAANNPKLADPAGQLVDFLDDPAGYVNADGKLDDSISSAVRTIETACGSSG